jgi:hypothetical protein
MDNRSDAVSRNVPSLKRVTVILELIDRVLADCDPQLVRPRAAVEEPRTPRRRFPVE